MSLFPKKALSSSPQVTNNLTEYNTDDLEMIIFEKERRSIILVWNDPNVVENDP